MEEAQKSVDLLQEILAELRNQSYLPIKIYVRLGSMLLDYVLTTIALVIFSTPVIFLLGFFHASINLYANLPYALTFIVLSIVFQFFNKDLFNGKSIAKQAIGLQVINFKTNNAAGPLRCLVRNVTCFIWPIEVIFSFFNSNRRIGDFMA